MRSTPANHQFPPPPPFPKKWTRPHKSRLFCPGRCWQKGKYSRYQSWKRIREALMKIRDPWELYIVYWYSCINSHGKAWPGWGPQATGKYLGLIYCWFRFSWFSICANLSSKGCATEDSCVFPKWQLSHCLFPSCHMHCGLHTVEQLFIWRRTAPDFEAEHVLSTI